VERELGFPGIRADVTWTLCGAPIERDHADHRSVEIDHERPGRRLGTSGTARSS
jgi:hypothetical protein